VCLLAGCARRNVSQGARWWQGRQVCIFAFFPILFSLCPLLCFQPPPLFFCCSRFLSHIQIQVFPTYFLQFVDVRSRACVCACVGVCVCSDEASVALLEGGGRSKRLGDSGSASAAKCATRAKKKTGKMRKFKDEAGGLGGVRNRGTRHLDALDH